MLTALTRFVVRSSGRSAVATVVATLAVCVAAAVYAGFTLRFNTEPDALFARDLPFRVAEDEFYRLFPGEADVIVVVVDGPSTASAERAADRLAMALSSASGLFVSVRQPTGGDFFKRNGLLYEPLGDLQALSKTLVDAQPLLGTLSTDPSARGLFQLITRVFDAAAAGDVAASDFAPSVDQVASASTRSLDGAAASIDWAALFAAVGRGDMSHRAFVLAQPKLDRTALQQAGNATDYVRKTASELGLTAANGFRVRLTGSVPLSDDEFATVAEGTGIAGLISVALVTVLLVLALESLKLVAAVLLTLVFGFLATAGWATLAVGELNLISIAFAVMFVGIAVDFGIQFCLRFQEERYRHEDLGKSLDMAAQTMALPLAQAAAATALGFFSFLPTAYRGVADLGIIAGGGIVIAFVLTLTFLPAVLVLIRPKTRRASVGYQWARPVNKQLLKHRRWVLGIAAAATLLAGLGLPRLVFDFDPLKLKDPKTESMATLLDLMQDPWATPNTLNVLTPSTAAAGAMAARLAALPEVRETMTILDFVPTDQTAKLAILDDLDLILGPTLRPTAIKPKPTDTEIANAAANARVAAKHYLDSKFALEPLRAAALRFTASIDRVLAERDPVRIARPLSALTTGFDTERSALADALAATPTGIDDLPADLRQSWVTADGRYRVQVYPAGDAREIDILSRFVAAVRAVTPEAIGPPVVIYETGRIVTGAFATAAVLGLFAIAVLLWATQRRIGDVAKTLMPLVLAATWTLGICALTGFPINFANIIGLPLLLGIGVTFPIYFVSVWRTGEPALLTSPMARGMLYSALTTAAAFGSLALSKHPGTADLGILLTMALGFTLLATLIFLPALLGPSPRPEAGQLC
ncbi:MAG TPA: MMPL family transporter [Candidatus Angelobacter sp.]|nr:MMPL family transporter [Candidatus Angelobacter sp.]